MLRKCLLLTLAFFQAAAFSAISQSSFVLSKAGLQDKIKGGWAGQTIGVTFGGPYEFRFQGSFIGDYQPLNWQPSSLKEAMINNPGLYDDLYMDLTFVDVFQRYGLDAPVDSFARAFAHAGYMLWHANQAARYNILNGIAAPASGFWKNNPHADCIDYQIEADFAGLMSPGMPNSASAISDKIGHIMNYGDGWYGGVYVGAMYSLAFVTSDIEKIVKLALTAVPAGSEFYRCINDVISWYQLYPRDWKKTWFEVQKKWANDIGCPDGVFSPFNIDAKVNAAYVVIGLLYGKGDFGKTIEIATRCGQDADCNPSSAAGILGTVLGYDRIPAAWKRGLSDIEDIPFKYTTISLNRVYQLGMEQALEMIRRNGGQINGDQVKIRFQKPVAVRFEQSFTGLYPAEKKAVSWSANRDEIRFEFEGTGFVLRGESGRWNDESDKISEAELWVDGKAVETIQLPVAFTRRRHELAWKYDLPAGKHEVRLKLIHYNPAISIVNAEAIIYRTR